MITPFFILSLVIGYFIVLLTIAYFTAKDDTNESFFKANRNSPWYLVAFGMVGASLSGVTFISVPGWVESSQFTYFQVVMGYLVGYFVVAYVLLPVYYKNNVTSIYEYLNTRLGQNSHKTGAFFFFVSRVLGAAFRLFLVAIVLQQFIFDALGVPYELTVVLSIVLIWVYTQKGGIKTIVFTDTLQTSLMIAAVILSIIYINQALDWSFSEFLASSELLNYNQVLVTDSMVVFSFVLVFVTALFMLLGALLYIYAQGQGIGIPLMDGAPKTDLLFPEIALNGNLGVAVAVTFILGLIAAAYSSADSALTSLTTSFCVDFLGIEKRPKADQKKLRKKTHLGMSLMLIIVVIAFKYVLDRNVIDGLLTVAGYTYGPLLGLFTFGIFTPYQIKDRYVWVVVLAVLGLVSILGNIDASSIGGYELGYELLPLNGLLTFLGLILIRRK